MTEHATRNVENLDSFEKLAMAFIEKHGVSHLKHVAEEDLSEVAVEFARIVSVEGAERVSNLRVFPVNMKDEFRQAVDSRSHSVNTQIKTSRGAIYFAGFSKGR
jgi:cyclopropane fatty-acyl-phospholipid synthase-like methyltransferase